MSGGVNRKVEQRLRALLANAWERRAAVCVADSTMRRAFDRRVQLGTVVSPARGVYIDAEVWAALETRPDWRHMAVVRALSLAHPHWTFCRETAALIHGLRISYPLLDRIHVVNGPGARGALGGAVMLHNVRDPQAGLVDGLRVTSPLVTALDCLRVLDSCEGLVIADAAAAQLGLTATGLREGLRRVGKGLPGIAKALSVAGFCDPRAESGGESLARAMMLRLRFVPPELQVWVENPLDKRHPFRVDCLWILPSGAVIICEVDGRGKREDEELTGGRPIEDIYHDERQRESLVSCTGARIIRLPFAEVRNGRAVERRLEAFGVPRIDSPEGQEMMRPDAAMRGGRPAPGGAVVRDGWLRF